MNRRNAASHLRSRDLQLPERVRNLLRYYIECAREDEGQSIRASLGDAGKRFIPWTFSSDLWHVDAAELTVVLRSDQLRFARELGKTGSEGSLLYGYPVCVEARRTLIPLFTWPIEHELHGRELWLHVTPEWPQMNPEYLKKLAETAEEEQEILDSLGLLDTSDDPPDSLIADILKRMDEMGLLPDVQETLDPQDIVRDQPIDRYQGPGLYNRAALFATEPPIYTRGLIRDLEEMVKTNAPRWGETALGTMLGVQNDRSEDEQTGVEVVPLNEEQRRAVRKAISSPLTAVTGPPGTGKSQIVVSMIADAYMRGRRVLFSSKNNKAVDVVEIRISDLASNPLSNPLMIRTGSSAGDRNVRRELAQRLSALLAFRPSQDDRRKYDALQAKYDALRRQEGDLWEELRTVRDAHSRLLSLDKAQASFEKVHAPHEWKELLKVKGRLDTDKLTAALRLADKHIDGADTLFGRFSLWRSTSKDRKRIQSIAAEAVVECPVLERPLENQSFRAWRTGLSRALSVAEALDATDAYQNCLRELGELRSRDEVARHLRRVRTELSNSGAELVALYARLAPDRLDPAGREAIGSFRALQERLAGAQLGGRAYSQVRRNMARLFPEVSRHIPAWCVTNLSARSSLPLEPNLFDLLIIDEASQCDIASALPLLYRSKLAVVIGDPQQLRHITKLERRRDHQLQSTHGLAVDDPKDHLFAYSQNSLFDLTVSRGAIGEVIQLQDHYRSHSEIVGFSNHHWYQDSLRIWTDYGRLKAPPDGKYGIRWTEVSGTAQRPRAGSVFILSEVEAIVQRVVDLLVNQGFDGTVGVVTPFRPQANMICERISQRVPQDLLSRAEFIVDTAHGFQGDERDIILFSPCVSQNLPTGARYFLATNENLFNVTVTRARSLLHVVGSREACSDSGIPHIQRFASYCMEIERSVSSPYETTLASDERVGPWERPLHEALVAKGLKPLPQYPVNQYRLDLAIISGDTRIDVEADGESTHLDPRIDAERDSRLENLGWRVVRFWNHQIRDDIDYCVRRVLDLVDRQP